VFYIYILKCSDGSYYVGHTDNIKKRVSEHKYGLKPCYTRKRLPITIVHVKDFPTRIEALAAERKIKGWSREKKEAYIRGDWKLLCLLANSKTTKQNHPSGPTGDPSTSSGRTGSTRKAM
jgi:predicted GIY-YIG superfamily endonuclease